jgi:hypothetical protein
VLHLWLIIISVGCDIPIDSKMFLVTDFVNLKIKLTQYFRDAYRDRMCIHMFMFIELSIHIYIYKYLYFYCVTHSSVLSFKSLVLSLTFCLWYRPSVSR